MNGGAVARRYGWGANSYTPAEDEIIVRMWQEGRRCAEIAAALPGRNKNGIGSRVNRMRLDGLDLPARREIVIGHPAKPSVSVERKRLFTDDPRAKADHGTGWRYTQRQLNHSPAGSSAAWAAQAR